MRGLNTLTRALGRLAMCFIAVLALAGCKQSKPPNVVFIVIDALRADHLSAYGYSRGTSPFLNELAEKGVLFQDAQAQSSITPISVPSMLTGLLPDKFLSFTRHEVLSSRVNTMAEIFQAHGYQTGGVQTNPLLLSRFGLDQGFDSYISLSTGDPMATNRKDSYRAEAANREAIKWVRGQDRKRPWFLYIHYMDVHFPYLPPEPFNRVYPAPDFSRRLSDYFLVHRYLKGRELMKTTPEQEALYREYGEDQLLQHMIDLYDGEIAYTDEQIRALLAAVADENTIVVISSDHGDEFNEHGGFGHGLTLHEEVTRVPMIFYGPGRVPAGIRVDSMVRNVDLLPTILELAGLAIPPDLDGRSLAAWEQYDSSGPESFAHLVRVKIGDDASSAKDLVSITTPEWKLIKDRLTGKIFLYDRAADPGENHDLAAEQPEKARELEARLDKIIAQGAAAKKALGITASAPTEIDPKLRGQMRALGYLDN